MVIVVVFLAAAAAVCAVVLLLVSPGKLRPILDEQRQAAPGQHQREGCTSRSTAWTRG